MSATPRLRSFTTRNMATGQNPCERPLLTYVLRNFPNAAHFQKCCQCVHQGWGPSAVLPQPLLVLVPRIIHSLPAHIPCPLQLNRKVEGESPKSTIQKRNSAQISYLSAAGFATKRGKLPPCRSRIYPASCRIEYDDG